MNNTSKSLVHGAVSVLLFGIPLVLMSNNTGLDLTIGGLLTATYHGLLMWSQSSNS